METCLPSSKKKKKKAQILDLQGAVKRKKNKNLTIEASSSRAAGRKLWEETEEIKKQWHVKTFPNSPSNRYSDFVVYKFKNRGGGGGKM